MRGELTLEKEIARIPYTSDPGGDYPLNNSSKKIPACRGSTYSEPRSQADRRRRKNTPTSEQRQWKRRRVLHGGDDFCHSVLEQLTGGA